MAPSETNKTARLVTAAAAVALTLSGCRGANTATATSTATPYYRGAGGAYAAGAYGGAARRSDDVDAEGRGGFGESGAEGGRGG